LLEFEEVHGAYRATKAELASRLYFYECDRLTSLNDEIEVAVAVLETVVKDAPAATSEPFRGDPFAEETEGLSVGWHAAP
jgi:hypothetical protein